MLYITTAADRDAINIKEIKIKILLFLTPYKSFKFNSLINMYKVVRLNESPTRADGSEVQRGKPPPLTKEPRFPDIPLIDIPSKFNISEIGKSI